MGDRFFNEKGMELLEKAVSLLNENNVIIFALGNSAIEFNNPAKNKPGDKQTLLHTEEYAKKINELLDGLTPSQRSRILFVGSTTKNERELAYFSNVVDYDAGSEVNSQNETWSKNTLYCPPANDLTGTSASAPVVTAMIASLMDNYNLSAGRACEILFDTADAKIVTREKGELDKKSNNRYKKT